MTQFYILVAAVIGLAIILFWPQFDNEQFRTLGWGFRNQDVTKKTLLWNQNQPSLLIPDAHDFPYDGIVYSSHLVNSAPVEKPYSPYQSTIDRPIVPNIRPRPVSIAPYANWNN